MILCERGIRTFETATRFTLDITAVPVVKKLSLLPIIVDVSHPTGQADLVPAVAPRGRRGRRRRPDGRGAPESAQKRCATGRNRSISQDSAI